MKFVILLSLAFVFSACSESPSSSDAYSYENNAFYSGQTPPPHRAPSSDHNFFNKTCKSTGNSAWSSGSQYECSYDE